MQSSAQHKKNRLINGGKRSGVLSHQRSNTKNNVNSPNSGSAKVCVFQKVGVYEFVFAVDRVTAPRSEMVHNHFPTTPNIEIVLLTTLETNVELIAPAFLQLRVRTNYIKSIHNSQAA